MSSDILYLSCGAYPVAVSPVSLILPQLPDRFHNYLTSQESFAAARLHFSQTSIEDSENGTEHWLFELLRDSKRLTYFLQNKARFSVRYSGDEYMVTIPELNTRNVMLGIQHAMLLALAQRCIGFHGVTLICKDRGVILSAPSGTGKTTLATLLQLHCDSVVINGDFALLSPCNEGVIFEPTPFCGTSGIAHNYRLKVDRVIFLEQSKNNRFCDLNVRQALIEFMRNTFLPNEDSERFMQIESLIIQILETVKVSKFSFAPTKEAAYLFQSIVTE